MEQEVWKKMMWSVLWITTLTAAAFAAGFCLGRLNREKGQKSGENSGDTGGRNPSEKAHGRRDRSRDENVVSWSVGSPVSGEIAYMQEGEHPTVVIEPLEDKLYAPAGGKITRLFPMGNELLFRTEFGAELHIQAGDAKDELLSRYYRPRIVQNEIVGKGKLLLEFDRRGLEAEGSSSQVSVRLESSTYGSDVRMTAGETVKTGEEILLVQEHYCHDGIRRD